MDAESVQTAGKRIAGQVHATPVETSATLDARLGTSVVVKNEALQKTGSFKVRGALNRLLTLPREEIDHGLVAISAGNHAAALAWAAGQVGAKATVVMPRHAPSAKVAACRDYGAEVVLHGDTTGEAFAEAERLRDDRGLTFVHPFDDPEIVAGQGTVALELVEAAGPVDVWVVPVGGGGLACGTALAVRAANPDCRVVGVEPQGAQALSAALEAGHPVPIVPRSIADGLCAPRAGERTFPLFRELVDEVVLLSDEEILAGVRFVMERMKVVVEPAGAAGVAALLAGRAGDVAGRRVGTVFSGGNLDLAAVVARLP
ncbi:MAG TPA: threonine/serine dehydratase [Actinomycetota bacterium]|nr:threonine/serine dehydratase [Actinomycetota bacterium]